MNEFYENYVTKRESCRSYDPDKQVTIEQLTEIVETARLAPSACNSQPWRYIAVTGEKAHELAKFTQDLGFNKFTSDCPAFLVVLQTPPTLAEKFNNILNNNKFADIDTGIGIAHLVLAATSLGLSTCILGWLNEEKIKAFCNIQTECTVKAIVAVGYPKEPHTLRPKKRLEIHEILSTLE